MFADSWLRLHFCRKSKLEFWDKLLPEKWNDKEEKLKLTIYKKSIVTALSSMLLKTCHDKIWFIIIYCVDNVVQNSFPIHVYFL